MTGAYCNWGPVTASRVLPEFERSLSMSSPQLRVRASLTCGAFPKAQLTAVKWGVQCCSEPSGSCSLEHRPIKMQRQSQEGLAIDVSVISEE